jgi:2'-5' RNA ligase
MRLFTGIELDAAVSQAAAGLIDALTQRTRRLAPRGRVGWVTAERLHVTVRFIGHCNDVVGARIRGELEPSLPVRPFALAIQHLGAFPPKGTPRVIWAGLTGDLAALHAVERAVTERLTRVGIPPEDRPYSPHLTLGRVKEPGGLTVGALFQGFEDAVLGTTAVEAITLFESRVSSKGPTYVPLLRTALTGA